MKIYSIGLNYSLVTSKIFAFCLLKILLKIVVLHISKSFKHILNGGLIFVKLLDNILFKHKVEEYLARD